METRIDQLVYELYGVTEQEISVIEGASKEPMELPPIAPEDLSLIAEE